MRADRLVSLVLLLRQHGRLSAAGVPVYAERGRRGAQAFGLGSALASAMRKVDDALPEGERATAAGAARRLLIDPEADLLSRRLVAEECRPARRSSRCARHSRA